MAFFLASAATTTAVSILCSLCNETICRTIHLYLLSAFISLTHTHVNVHAEAGTALSDARAEPPLVSHVSLITRPQTLLLGFGPLLSSAANVSVCRACNRNLALAFRALASLMASRREGSIQNETLSGLSDSRFLPLQPSLFRRGGAGGQINPGQAGLSDPPLVNRHPKKMSGNGIQVFHNRTR